MDNVPLLPEVLTIPFEVRFSILGVLIDVVAYIVPFTSNVLEGDIVPIPTFPFKNNATGISGLPEIIRLLELIVDVVESSLREILNSEASIYVVMMSLVFNDIDPKGEISINGVSVVPRY
jgi:uncharacterized membrane protein